MPQVKCEYCGAFVDETEEKCPNCGAVNANFKRIVTGTPKTIEELKDWYMARKLPPESVTRFFIGKDIQEPKAFGIYKDGSEVVVYKNKADGSRAIRYKGTDEAYAVNELYMKLKSEILNQKSRNINRGGSGSSSGSGMTLVSIIMGITALVTLSIAMMFTPLAVFGVLLFMIVGGIFLFKRDAKKFFIAAVVTILLVFTGTFAYIIGYRTAHKHDGYYFNGSNYYYFQGHDVYQYADDDWYYYDTYDTYDDFTSEYPYYEYIGDDYEGYEDYSDFSDSYYYDDDGWSGSSSSSDWSGDSDYDWDSGGSDWDSGSSDWGSDW